MNHKIANTSFSQLSSLQKLQRICLTILGLGLLFALTTLPAQAADPIFAQQSKLTPGSPATGQLFGRIIAAYGDWAVFAQPNKTVGTNSEQGTVYVYLRSGNSWTLMQTLTASDGALGDNFGCSVVLNQNYMIIGAYGKNAAAGNDVGAAYVFARIGSLWQEQQKLTPNDGQANFRFGTSVAINSDTIFVGASQAFTPISTNAGAVYTFTLSGFTWVQQQKLTAFDATAQVGFGGNISVSGTSLAVTTSYSPFNNTPPGAVYLFTQSGGVWFYQQKLTSPDPQSLPAANYGHAISMSGNTLAVGGERGFINEKVYVYVLSGSVWALQQTVTAPDSDSVAFGSGVALEGNRLVIGCEQDMILSAQDRGSAYVFERTGGVWNLRQKLIAADGVTTDRFGGKVALSSDTIIVGAWQADIPGGQNQGAEYIFTLQNGNTLPTLTPNGPHTIQSGSTANNLLLAVLADAETPISSLLFDYDNTQYLTFSNIQKSGNYVTGSITCNCSAYTGDTKAELNVIDGNSAVGVSTITVNKTANTAPEIGRYPVTSIAAGGTKTVSPQVAPSDNGTFTISVSVAPSGFTGNISINQATGAITFSNVGGVGTYTVTVTVKDNCNATTIRTFTLTVF
ncbi:MAG: hypothetical protein JNK38_13425 [Acidobacteria bacterium]|nr:hypothetical protein [Acidobacteriota bacterium]